MVRSASVKFIIFCLVLIVNNNSYSQFGNKMSLPISFDKDIKLSQNTLHEIVVDKSKIEELRDYSDLKGPYQVAISFESDLTFKDFELKHVLPSGDKLYQLEIRAEDALAMMVRLDDINFENGEKLWIVNTDSRKYLGEYSQEDVNRDDYFLTSIISGEKIIIEFLEPKNVISEEFSLSKIYYFYKGIEGAGFGESESCMINAACTEGDSWADPIDATCKIVIPAQGSVFFCSGTLVNNTANDGTPMILTANHCSKNSVLGDLVDWEYHFRYHSTSCSNPLSEPGFLNFRGSKALAYSGADNGDFSSDFLLVQLLLSGTTSQNYTFLGWDRSGSATLSGVAVHHPAGDIKKISTYNLLPTPASYQGNVSGTHFEVFWASTGIGRQSVTEGGSSGGGLINSAGRLIGTLTGGAATCSQRNAPDYYGRLSRHWNSYGTANDRRVDVWLDHASTGTQTVNTVNTTMKSTTVAASIKTDNKQDVIVTYLSDKVVVNWENIIYNIDIYSIQGNKVIEKSNVKGANVTDISLLNSGIYIVNVSNDETSKSFKIHKR